jgi:hypothetical protein
MERFLQITTRKGTSCDLKYLPVYQQLMAPQSFAWCDDTPSFPHLMLQHDMLRVHQVLLLCWRVC